MVDDTIPPTIGTAMRRMTSEPVPVLQRIVADISAHAAPTTLPPTSRLGTSRAASQPVLVPASGRSGCPPAGTTEASIKLVPLLAHMGGWGLRHTPASKELSIRAQILEDGGPLLWSAFMEELRHLHLGAKRPEGSVFARLQSAYEEAIAE